MDGIRREGKGPAMKMIIINQFINGNGRIFKKKYISLCIDGGRIRHKELKFGVDCIRYLRKKIYICTDDRMSKKKNDIDSAGIFGQGELKYNDDDDRSSSFLLFLLLSLYPFLSSS